MRKELVEIHEHLMKVSVSGESIEPMFMALVKLAGLINYMPEEEEGANEPNTDQ